MQFLFAFLLIVPFQQKIDQVTDFQRGVYFVALASAALATALLIAPAAQHRMLFRQQDKEALLQRSNRSAIAGLVALGVAICAALLLVVDVLFSLTLAWVDLRAPWPCCCSGGGSPSRSGSAPATSRTTCDDE